MNKLPIYEVLDDLKSKLNENNRIILQATTGVGKSTVVPIELLQEQYIKNKKIIVLEPRRVAARVVATRLAKNLGEEVGKTVGYQVKLDSCFCDETKILVVTEAILIRKIQASQSLDDIGLIIFDEFHERSIYTDLSLAFCLQIQEFLRDDLKLLIMSATLNCEKLSSFLQASIVTSIAKNYEVKTIYLDPNIKQPSYDDLTLVMQTINKAVKSSKKDILVFLPGFKQIMEVKNSLKLSDDILVLPLYSNLDKKQQDLAINKQEKRKVILATNVAQTSLTIEGVNIVIDTGLEKISRYDSSTGMNHLELCFISLESATQRQGRAGRLEEGTCYKLWHKSKILEKSSKPEILRTDLTQTLLELSLWQIDSFEDLKWLDIPDEISILHAKKLLIDLKMIDEKYNITSFGKKAISLGIHPRFAYMILKANELGFAYEASLLASILNTNNLEGDIYNTFVDCYEYGNNNAILKESRLYLKKLEKIQKIKKEKFDYEMLGVLALYAYPDRLAKIRDENDIRYKLSNNKGAKLHKNSYLFNEKFLVAVNINAKSKDSFIIQALKIKLANILKYFKEFVKIQQIVNFDRQLNKLIAKEFTTFLDLSLSSQPLKIQNNKIPSLILNLIKTEGLELLNWDKKAISLKQRVEFVNKNNRSLNFPSFCNDELINTLDEWLEIYLLNIKSVDELKKLDLYNILINRLSWEQQQNLEKLAPVFFDAPSGSKIKINYTDINKPKISIKIQEIFGTYETPKVLDGKIPLQIELLTPALRPIQITYDLKSFWQNSYAEVRKELRGKYKKHYWPENPHEAQATNKTKKKM
ncbi:ATP-dependent helicase HrpB [Arcobacter sp. CECT 8985]|uniref:ATP-dependent helicase HrpB n=1 Tax=Arcobacter sp. CECT 8985 TaxID=1935424 RepID=UPI00100C06C8|nr:ATP-dependent helicase HrpB [Arcobacter sp. CECT 8985]RXJ86365.1 ATP-dependent helicase HrpB [Arcobacter sp. CECT 8985]